MADDIKNKIKKEWVTQAMSGMKAAEDQKISEESLDQEAVLLVEGKNLFGDDVYSYVKVSLRNYRDLRMAMVKGENFTPSDYGQVIAAGRGEPPQEIKDEMRVKYEMVDLTQRVKATAGKVPNPKPPNLSQPTIFDSNEDVSN